MRRRPLRLACERKAAPRVTPPPQRSRAQKTAAPKRLWLYGRHAVAAALSNDARKIRRVMATKNALDWLADAKIDADGRAHVDAVTPDAIDKALPAGAVHQGLAAEVLELPRARLKETCAAPIPTEPVVILDQITDPQNIGAIFRAAAAFHARAIIVQERRTPPLAGALAKAAAGAVETLPCVQAVNIARSIEALQNLGYFVTGLAGDSDTTIKDIGGDRAVALVMGAEGAGLRPLVAQSCDILARIPISGTVESLNVSTAAAIALYEVTSR